MAIRTCGTCANWNESDNLCKEWARHYDASAPACDRWEPADGSMPEWANKPPASPKPDESDGLAVQTVGRRLRILPMRGRRTQMTASLSARGLHANNVAWRAIGNPKRVFVEVDQVARVLYLIAGDGTSSFKVTKSGSIVAPALMQTLARYGFGPGRYHVTAVDGKELHLRRRDNP